MSDKKRILFIANEMSPYLELTEFAEVVNKLAIKSNEIGMEVRCIMPRFGVINERRHKLHEVVRLSGLNISLNGEDYPLQIKVASLPNARLQIYFLDNEDYFKRKFLFHDEEDKWFEDNDIRTVLFAKGAIETIKKFAWPPDVIHCSGWMTSLIPMYIKVVYKREPVFFNSKIIYTIGENTFTEQIGKDFEDYAQISDLIGEKEMEFIRGNDNISMFKLGATYSDAISFGSENVDASLKKIFEKISDKPVIEFNPESDLTDYLQLFTQLTE